MSCYLKLKYTKGNSLCKCIIASSPSEKLLGITLDSELKFEEHINKISNIVKKNPALHRIWSHMSLDEKCFYGLSLNLSLVIAL